MDPLLAVVTLIAHSSSNVKFFTKRGRKFLLGGQRRCGRGGQESLNRTGQEEILASAGIDLRKGAGQKKGKKDDWVRSGKDQRRGKVMLVNC